ncbi:hypothetical protein HKX42_10205 [Salinisphaera sp. USBA-960]|nr:hypothetical protein [Salifodinibacter halophilus]NNC27246.1 hypothetical protein [Salifodinibacter halophilus]
MPNQPKAGSGHGGAFDAAELRQRETTVLSAGDATAPRVSVVWIDEKPAVFKDYATTAGFFRAVIAPLLVTREVSALRRLDGVAGVPDLIRQIGRRGLLMDYLPAQPLPRAQTVSTTLRALESLVASMHDAGVAHADLRAARNVLVDEHGAPYIVDFVARVHRGARWNWPWNWLFEQFAAADRSALAKLRLRYAPTEASEADQRLAAHSGARACLARAIGGGTRRVVRWVVNRTR